MSRLHPIPDSDTDSGTSLAARLRPQFAQPVILVDSDDPVIGGPRCLAPVCERLAVAFGKCSAHHQRWIDEGRPDDVETWAKTAQANRRWLQQPPKCAIAICRRSRREHGLCHSHASRWRQQGRLDLPRWIADGGGPPLQAGHGCRFPGCGLDAEGEAGLCVHHRNRWIRADRPPIESWLLGCATFGRDRFDLRPMPMPMPMRLEIAYAIQCRVDERRTITRPHSIRRLLRASPGGGVASLLDRSPESWMAYLGFSRERGHIERRFLLDAVGYLRDLVEGVGWDAEFPPRTRGADPGADRGPSGAPGRTISQPERPHRPAQQPRRAAARGLPARLGIPPVCPGRPVPRGLPPVGDRSAEILVQSGDGPTGTPRQPRSIRRPQQSADNPHLVPARESANIWALTTRPHSPNLANVACSPALPCRSGGRFS
ncbi:hypothetical protein [Amycolatopsis taiwanensis]|uniref:hypothetical protein n=1 Tax=Amycolatopsis taiwanensis TaxID=342230 RepID=UPI0025521C46|nr:hypothetical protein [Amycolatopsis taiwanensis]